MKHLKSTGINQNICASLPKKKKRSRKQYLLITCISGYEWYKILLFTKFRDHLLCIKNIITHLYIELSVDKVLLQHITENQYVKTYMLNFSYLEEALCSSPVVDLLLVHMQFCLRFARGSPTQSNRQQIRDALFQETNRLRHTHTSL